jgi:hypothetical protein
MKILYDDQASADQAASRMNICLSNTINQLSQDIYATVTVINREVQIYYMLHFVLTSQEYQGFSPYRLSARIRDD